MKKHDVIIIGAGPAGIIAGVTAKKQNPNKQILMITEAQKGLVPCGIPYVFNNLDDVSQNAMGPKSFVDAGGELIIDKLISIDAEAHQIKTASGIEYLYGKLVFATGSQPVVPTFIPGYDLDGVDYIKKNYAYIESLQKKARDAKHIIVIGGGFIGAEVAEQLHMRGDAKVSLIELEKNCFSKAFSSEMAEIATEKLREAGVNVLTSTKVVEFIGESGKVTGVRIDSGEVITADLIISSVGYKPNTDLAKNTGVRLNTIGAIYVDNYGRSNLEDIFAVGDCAGTKGFITGSEDNIMLASTATAEARILGYNLFGIRIKRCFAGTLGVFSTKIHNFSMASAGLNDNSAKAANVHFIKAEFTDVDRHPGTLKDTSPLSVRLFASSTDGSILGGEVWGGDSAGEIINIISLAIQKKVSVYELVSFQIGTHPLLTAAPTKYQLIKAAEGIIAKLQK
ncbi:MAG: FAD-dependent oxidoreductase [Bacteroidales bacterium]|jgi:NADH oxidase (H2O2-forming)|nr:FAD-dependent oxidoreductase [Bacteroidales bacterium]